MLNIQRLERTGWWHDLIDGIYGPRKGGARIIIDAQDASTGAGKTGLAIALAKTLSWGFGYELQEEDMTLSGAAYLQRWREHPGAEQPSVIILDEAAGAGAANARRAMSTQNVNLVKAWQLMRKKRIVSIMTLPQWSLIDKSMRKQADYRLWCLTKPIGYFKPYRVRTSFDTGEVTTHGYDDVQRIRFPNLD
ncbi:MAG: zonular occludens toxin domain-containing protein, partial [Haloferacaceae archaeon]|nr:zonular occludens toxin domain-containing protein [Haloferacaceae archaeon]